MDKPLISIVVPVYNAERDLERCLDSIQAQTCPSFEALLVDDASSDASAAICQARASRDSRFRVVRLPANGGPSRARNEGVRRARGAFLTFIDADDFAEPRLLEVLYDALCTAKADISVCGYAPSGHPDAPARTYRDGEIVPCVIRHTPFGWAAWGKLYKAELVRRNPFDESVHLAEDLLFVYQLAKQAACVRYQPDRLYHYNDHRDRTRPFNRRANTAFTAYESVLRDLSVRFPELLPGFQGTVLALLTAHARDAALCPALDRPARRQALRQLQHCLRQVFQWRALACCPPGARAKVLLLYASAAAFESAAALWNIRAETEEPWNSR